MIEVVKESHNGLLQDVQSELSSLKSLVSSRRFSSPSPDNLLGANIADSQDDKASSQSSAIDKLAALNPSFMSTSQNTAGLSVGIPAWQLESQNQQSPSKSQVTQEAESV
jgi:hypothetical protein